jgi:hypothetical protein
VPPPGSRPQPGSAARRLGNTRAVCRKCFVHPAVLDAYLDGSLLETLRRRVRQKMAESLHDLSAEEGAVLAFLQKRLAQESGGPQCGGPVRHGNCNKFLPERVRGGSNRPGRAERGAGGGTEEVMI